MKKTISLLLAIVMVLPILLSLGSCGQATVGTEAAKILLARERLDENSIRNISFLPGFVTDALASLPEAEQDEAVEFLSDTSTKPAPPSGKYHEWTEFTGNAGSFDAFDKFRESLNEMVVEIADSIAHLRQNVNITGKWVTTGFIETRRVMLLVTETAEYLFEREDAYGSRTVSIRYTNENADSVYERYYFYDYGGDQGFGEIKAKCIPGKYYEDSYDHYSASDRENPDFSSYNIAENSRGYWVYMQFNGEAYGQVPINLYVMKNGVASHVMMMLNKNGTIDPSSYAAYDLETRRPLVEKSTFTVRLYYSAIKDGLKAIRAYGETYNSIEEREHLGNVGYEPHGIDLIAITDKGEWLYPGDTRGMIKYDGAVVHYDPMGNNYSGWLELGYVNGPFNIPIMNATDLAIEYAECYGISIDVNRSYLEEALGIAEDLASGFKGMYEWCGVVLNDYDDVIEAIDVLRKEFDDMEAEFVEAESLPDASGFSLPQWQSFPAVEGFKNGSVSYKDGVITVDGMSLLISNTNLLEAGNSYMIKLGAALLDENGRIIPANVLPLSGGDDSTIFGGEGLALTQSGSYTLPTGLAAGKYQVVAYAATSDGIRVSQMVPIGYYNGLDTSFESADMDIQVKAENEHLYLVYTVSRSLVATLDTLKDSYTVEEIERAIKNVALRHGYTKAGAALTTADGEAVARDATLTQGTYRMSAYIASGTGVAEIYIYLTIPTAD